MRSITFNGLNSLEDMNLTMSTSPQISFPEKIKIKERVPGTNKVYDFSTVLGTQPYEEREIFCVFNILDFDKMDLESSHLIATQAINWLMRPTEKARLELDFLPDYYFMAEVESIGEWETNVFKFGTIEVIFKAYPFKISTFSAGRIPWDALNFKTDYLQKTDTQLDGFESQLPLEPLTVGTMVTIGGWAQYYASGGGVAHTDVARFYTISQVRQQGSVDFANYIFDTTQYYLKEINAWVRAQDIVQSYRTGKNIHLKNTGITPIQPRIELQKRVGYFSSTGITVEKDDNFYVIKYGEQNNKFVLDIGDNDMIIYGGGYDVNIDWNNEVL